MKYYKYLILILFIFLSGCHKMFRWGESFFAQVEKMDMVDIQNVRASIRGKKVYDEFNFIASFDVLLFSDFVKRWYCSVMNELKNDFCINNVDSIDEKKYKKIIFYVLALSVCDEDLSILSSNVAESLWRVKLFINDECFYPLTIENQDIDSLFLYIFADKFSRFKSFYKLEFHIDPLLYEHAENIYMQFFYGRYAITLQWDSIQ